MDFAKFVSQMGNLLAGDCVYYIIYAVATCIVSQLVKKLFVNKAKVDVLHKFDWATVIPFIVATGFAALDLFVVQEVRQLDFNVCLKLILSALTIGALSSTGYKFVKSLSGQSLASLMKNDVFGVFYTQLLYFGDVRKQIADNKLTLQDFVDQVKLLAANAEAIYREEGSVDNKRCQLAKLLAGIVDDANIDTCVNVINEALVAFVSEK